MEIPERSISARSRRSARSSTRRRSRRSTRADFRRPRRRSQPGVRVGRGDGGLRAARRQTARTDLGRRARRHQHADDHQQRQRARHAARVAARAGAGRAVADRRILPKVRPEHTVLIGIRNLDAREKESLSASGAHVFTMKDIDRSGIASIVEQALAIAGAGTAGIHVSFDLDVCDPSIAPGVGTPVKGGLDYREAHMVMEMIGLQVFRALDLVEVNPILDDRNTTAVLGAELCRRRWDRRSSEWRRNGERGISASPAGFRRGSCRDHLSSGGSSMRQSGNTVLGLVTAAAIAAFGINASAQKTTPVHPGRAGARTSSRSGRLTGRTSRSSTAGRR